MSCVVISTSASESDADRRERLWRGELVSLPPRPAVRALGDFAWELITKAFDGRDPHLAHEDMPVEDYVRLLGPLKTGFTHHPEAKRLIRELLADLGCDTGATYYDVPRMRVVTPASYLTAGLGYNYLPHRDTWYSAPQCQVNWWAPISGVTGDSCMEFHPDFWQQRATNTSNAFDAYEWNKSARREAASYIKDDPRPHPHLSGGDAGSSVRLVGERGSIIVFAGEQLHATVPNRGRVTRFSFDFRTVHIHDVRHRAGPAKIDSASTGTTLRDFVSADGLERLPEDLIAPYDVGGSVDGVLVFDPSVLSG